MNAFIRLLYAVLIAGAVVAFIGVGVASIYQSPKIPEQNYKPYNLNASQVELDKEQVENYKVWKDHQENEKAYYKKVSMVVLPAAVVVLVFGLVYMKKSELVGEGLALGGIGTSLYSIIIASMANQNILRLLSVTLLLIGALLIAHRRFLEPSKKK